MGTSDTKLHSYVAHSFSGRPHVPLFPRLSQLLCLNAIAYEFGLLFIGAILSLSSGHDRQSPFFGINPVLLY